MNTPICDFVRSYIQKNTLRLHMPGHKGVDLLGFEAFDITEISGADSLYEADGIIKESELNASQLFGSNTFYSTEGSSLCIRAMLYLVSLFAKEKGIEPLVLAARNAHKTFLSAVALLDIDVEWLYPTGYPSYLSCKITPEYLKSVLEDMDKKPVAVYLTSPDYLGNMLDIKAIAKVCHKYGVLLIVDNAHGAYLKFLKNSKHPIDLGADICCDSAHKTLPALTGGAYLHISLGSDEVFCKRAKDALSLFGSTSPSYLILQSLDAVNKYLSEGYSTQLDMFIKRLDDLKFRLIKNGYTLVGTEPLKITISTKPYGYTGREFAKILLKNNIVCEFCDPDFVVMMLTPEIGTFGLMMLEKALLSIPARRLKHSTLPKLSVLEKKLTVREAMFSPCETVLAKESKGKILATPSVSCPPAVPIAIPGEVITSSAVKCFAYYGIKEINVIK